MQDVNPMKTVTAELARTRCQALCGKDTVRVLIQTENINIQSWKRCHSSLYTRESCGRKPKGTLVAWEQRHAFQLSTLRLRLCFPAPNIERNVRHQPAKPIGISTDNGTGICVILMDLPTLLSTAGSNDEYRSGPLAAASDATETTDAHIARLRNSLRIRNSPLATDRVPFSVAVDVIPSSSALPGSELDTDSAAGAAAQASCTQQSGSNGPGPATTVTRSSERVPRDGTPSLHPAATPLYRYSFYGPLDQQQPRVPRRDGNVDSDSDCSSDGSPTATADRRRDYRARDAGGTCPPHEARIARIRSQGSLGQRESPNSAPINVPRRETLLAISMARSRPSMRPLNDLRAAPELDGTSDGARISDAGERSRATSASQHESPSPSMLGCDISAATFPSNPAIEPIPAQSVFLSVGLTHFAAQTTPLHLRFKNAMIVTCITLGYGISMFINGIAGRILPPRPNAYTGNTTPLALRIVASLPDPLFVLTSGRAISLVVVLGLLLRFTRMQTRIDELSQRMFLPMLIGLLNALGYAFFVALCGMASVSIWSAMIAVWIVVPVLYDVIVFRAPCGPQKALGIACCVTAGVVLGVAGTHDDISATGENEGPAWLKTLLFLFAVASWSVADTLSAYVMTLTDDRGRSLGIVSVVGFTAGGFILAAWAASGVSFVLSSWMPPADHVIPALTNSTPPSDHINVFVASYHAPEPLHVLAGNALLFFGNFVGALSWYGVVLLGADSTTDVARMLPLTALEAFVCSLLGVACLGEPLGPLGVIGSIVGVGGVILVARVGERATVPPVSGALALGESGS